MKMKLVQLFRGGVVKEGQSHLNHIGLSPLRLVLLSVLVVLVSTSAFSQTAISKQSQGNIQTAKPAIPTFSGGRAANDAGKTLAAEPPALTQADKIKLTGANQVSTYAKVSVKQPVVSGRGSLQFISPLEVDPAHNFASMRGETNSYGRVNLTTTASNKVYLLDVSVRAENAGPGCVFTIIAPDVTTKETINCKAGGQHLSFLFKSEGNSSFEFRILSNQPWRLFSCEISTP